MSGIFWPTRIFASRLSTVVMRGFEMMLALRFCSSSWIWASTWPQLLTRPYLTVVAGSATEVVWVARIVWASQ